MNPNNIPPQQTQQSFSDSTTARPIIGKTPNASSNEPHNDYHFQLGLLEQQNKGRLQTLESLEVLAKIAAVWSEYNHLQQTDKPLTEKWQDTIRTTNQEIEELASSVYPRLPILLYDSLTKEECALYHSQVAFVHILFQEADKLKLAHRCSADSSVLAKILLKIIDAYINYLHQHIIFFTQYSITLSKESKNVLEDVFTKKDNKFREVNQLVDPTGQKAGACYLWKYLPTLQITETLKPIVTENSLAKITEEHKKLEQSSKVEFTRLCCLLVDFNNRIEGREKVELCTIALTNKMRTESHLNISLIEAEIDSVASRYSFRCNSEITTILHKLKEECSRLLSELLNKEPATRFPFSQSSTHEQDDTYSRNRSRSPSSSDCIYNPRHTLTH